MRTINFRGPDNQIIQVQLKRRGGKNSRIVFHDDGHEEVVPNDLLDFDSLAVIDDRRVGTRIVPITPLRSFYYSVRELTGSREERFEPLKKRLQNSSDEVSAFFLAELFSRSHSHMEFFNNREEPFYKSGSRPPKTNDHFATELVDLLSNAPPVFGDGVNFIGYVDYEINPLRTTSSCFESGEPAKSSGAGGMDLLLISGEGKNALPAIGEIKAKTEQVGPTFALIQAMTYAAELVTNHQWLRLGNYYPEAFGEICVESRTPCVDLLLILESPVGNGDDLRFAVRLAERLLEDDRVSSSIRKIQFLKGQINDETVSINAVDVQWA